MTMLLVCVILVAAGYAIVITRQYYAFAEEIQPRIAQLEKKAVNLGKTIASETRTLVALQERVGQGKEAMQALQREVVTLEQETKEAVEKESQLEMDLYKQDFKLSKRRS